MPYDPATARCIICGLKATTEVIKLNAEGDPISWEPWPMCADDLRAHVDAGWVQEI